MAEEAALALRRAHPTWGPRKVRAWLRSHRPAEAWPAASTLGQLFTREGLTARRGLRRRTPPRGRPLSGCAGPNDLWTVDFKGWFPTGDGARREPLTPRDAHSRHLPRRQALPRADAERTWAAVEAALREFGPPRAPRGDNGPPFASRGAGGLSRLGVWPLKAGAVPERAAPGRPERNGRHERLHLTLKRETASPPAGSLREQAGRFARFQRPYNEERPQEALGQEPPARHYAPSPRTWSGRLVEPEYPEGCLARRVRTNGEIKWGGGTLFAGEALIGEPVALVEAGEGGWRMFYAAVELGRVDHRAKLPLPRRGPWAPPGEPQGPVG
ncbi:MAG: transposase [Candidatus Tectomicrobia bacterium]|nr:transposase [Candidatus Tectomicrobia bacterium]